MKIFNLLAIAQVFAQENDEDSCNQPGEVEVDGFCFENAAEAAKFQAMMAEADAEDEQPGDAASQLGRRFSMGPSDSSQGPGVRTKKRTQRISFLIAQVGAKQEKNGKRLRPREFLKRVNGYGCHCWTKPGTEAIGYKGQPVDEIDRSCKSLKSCHTCIELEYSNCDPVTTKYRAKVQRQGDGTLQITCTNTLNKKGTNNGDCKKSLCECDKAFAMSMAESWNDWSEDFWNLDNQGLFDSSCSVINKERMVSSGPPDQCCGTGYPDMKPFYSETHQCTDAHVMPINNI